MPALERFDQCSGWADEVLTLIESSPLPHLERLALHAQQAHVVATARRFNVLACGRRWGKTALGADRVVEPLLAGYPVGWFSPTYKYLLDVWQDLVRTLAPITVRKNTTERRIETTTGGTLECWTLDDRDAGRGRKYARAVIDEAAMAPHLEHAWTHAIRATLADLEGDAYFLSTPKGHNYFWRLWQRGQDAAFPEWAAWQMPTSTLTVPEAEIGAMRTALPVRVFEQEVLAAFTDDAGGVFRGVMQAATANEQRHAIDGHAYVFGVDWGKVEDFTVITVIDTTTNEACYLDRFNRIDYDVQVGRLKALYERFRPSLIVAERNSMGEPLVERLRKDRLPVRPFLTTHASKGTAIDALALAFERGDLAILPDPVLVAELQAYEAERLPSGTFRYNAPSGMHDDTVMSLALAWSAAAAPGPSRGYYSLAS